MASASTVHGNKQYIPMKKLDEKQGSGGKGNRPKMDYNRSVSFVRRLNIVQVVFMDTMLLCTVIIYKI